MHQQLRDRIAQAILGVAVPGVLIATVIAIEASYFFSPGRSLLPCWISGAGALVSALLGWRGRPHQGTAFLIFSLMAAVCGGMWLNGGVLAPAYLLSVPLVVLVATVHGQKWAWIFT